MADGQHVTTEGPATVDGTMRAVVRDEYGSVDVVRLARVARPEPADDEVLVRVHAAGLDRGVWHLMTGLPYAAGSRSDCAGRRTRCWGPTSPAPSSRSVQR